MALLCLFCTDEKGRVKLKLSKKHKTNNWFFCPKCLTEFHIKQKHNGKKKAICHPEYPKGKTGHGRGIDHRLLEA